MNIIPVIDLLQGQAVHAKQGRRAEYKPLQTPLCQNGEVEPFIQRLCDNYAITHLYLADLDAIQGHGNNFQALHHISTCFPHLVLWIDAGFKKPADIQKLQTALPFRPVIATETWQYKSRPPFEDAILSIDIGDDGLRDPSGISADESRRPETLILMDLVQVGSNSGPNLKLLSEWQSKTSDTHLYTAGGVRNLDDLQQLQIAGAAGVLLASALHDGALTAVDLTSFS